MPGSPGRTFGDQLALLGPDGVKIELVTSDQKDAPPIVDFDKMAENSKKLGEYCVKNPGHSVITAADKTLGSDK